MHFTLCVLLFHVSPTQYSMTKVCHCDGCKTLTQYFCSCYLHGSSIYSLYQCKGILLQVESLVSVLYHLFEYFRVARSFILLRGVQALERRSSEFLQNTNRITGRAEVLFSVIEILSFCKTTYTYFHFENLCYDCTLAVFNSVNVAGLLSLL